MTKHEIIELFSSPHHEMLYAEADRVRAEHCGNGVHIRAIIEFSNNCVRNCLYCGLRRDNKRIHRFSMETEQLLPAVAKAASDGIKTIVLQSGDDPDYTVEDICTMVRTVKHHHPDMAVTLSVGERPMQEYKAFRAAGADRYLMKHETASTALYDSLHPGQTLQQRVKTLSYLKTLGFQVGSGFMVGLPGQTVEDLADDILLLKKLQPDMAGIGPFVPQKHTPLSGCRAGSLPRVLTALALTRLATRNAHMPATTALATIAPHDGLVRGLRAGCNVIMCDYTPDPQRRHYTLYDNKARITLAVAKAAIAAAGRTVSFDRADSLKAGG